jgi:hypothetical protein
MGKFMLIILCIEYTFIQKTMVARSSGEGYDSESYTEEYSDEEEGAEEEVETTSPEVSGQKHTRITNIVSD